MEAEGNEAAAEVGADQPAAKAGASEAATEAGASEPTAEATASKATAAATGEYISRSHTNGDDRRRHPGHDWFSRFPESLCDVACHSATSRVGTGTSVNGRGGTQLTSDPSFPSGMGLPSRVIIVLHCPRIGF
jgi:hypothetical protein